MPVYRRYRRYRRGRRRYYGRRRYRRSYARRYVNASSRSSIRMKCVVTGSSTLKSGYADTLSDTPFHILPFDKKDGDNPVPVTASPLFTAYQKLYEEMKLIGLKIQISVTDQIGGSTLPSLQIYTAWDRRHGQLEADYTSSEIKESASSNVATALNNNVAKLSRSLYASDLIEKAQWMDSTIDSQNRIQSWVAASNNPNFFCPAFFMAFGSPSLSAGSEVASVHFSISVTYYVAFRNPRYGGSGGASKDLPAKEVSFVDDDSHDVDMGGDDVIILSDDDDVSSTQTVRAAAAAAAPAPAPREGSYRKSLRSQAPGPVRKN